MQTKDKSLTEFFYEMYSNFGQFAVINFVRDRQDNGQLSWIVWKDCDGCDWHTPYDDDTCLVCGGN